ncbi:MAG: phosphoribosylglycinamide formyltransferase [Chitinispirillales bacterium]|jgi:formyltetrahydrofolate-dependent phosphoribosylglycinamide formyltransferase|nr:phosphoribosylglycinamide formyltransferase [Chitinispirillales bacterium]
MNCAFFVSGRGSNFEAVLKQVKIGNLKIKIPLIVSSSETAPVVETAKSENIEVFYANKENRKKILDVLLAKKIDLIVLAGYIKKIPDEIIFAFKNKIINIHPSLLPAFGGKGMFGEFVHKAVIDKGVKISGLTIHLVDEKYDNGAILFQKAVDVKNNYTPQDLAKRILIEEHDSLWKVIKAFSQNRVIIDGSRAKIADE